MTSSTLANRFLSIATQKSAEPDWRWAADQIQQAGRFVLAGDVIRLSVRDIDTDKLLPTIAHGLRLPHDPCWIEWSPKEVFTILADSPTAVEQYGMLFWRDDAADVCNRLLVRGPKRGFFPQDPNIPNPDERWLLLYPCDAVYRPSGIAMRATKRLPVPEDMPPLQRTAQHLAWFGLWLLLILTAKNAPLNIGEAEDFSRLNKQRQRKGRPPLLSAHPVRWNLSRVERRAARSGMPLTDEDRRAAIAHMVRGHIKFRKTGAFWWSPHFRNAGDSPPSGGRDYDVR